MSETEPRLIQGYRLKQLSPAELPAFFAGLAPHFPEAVALGLRFGETEKGMVVPFLPHWSATPKADKARVLALRGKIAEIYQSALSRGFDAARLGVVSMDVSGLPHCAEAAVKAMRAALQPVEAEAGAGPRMCLVIGGSEAVAEEVAAVVRRSRHAAVIPMQDEITGAAVAVIRLSDDPEDGATLAGLRALKGGAPIVCAPQETPAGTIWAPDHLALPAAAKPAAAQILEGLAALSWLSEGRELVLAVRDGGKLVYLAAPREAPSLGPDDLAADAEPLQPLAVSELAVQPSEAALAQLQERVVTPGFPVGYRVSLQPVPEIAAREDSVETLREEIEEREAQIELIRALAAPQMGLLRFSDAQLPALVDGLRRLPSRMLREGGLRYAAAHAAGRAEPAHFLLYDPARVAVEGRLPEHYWRGRTENRPMRYWLDPHAAEATLEAEGAPLVFVPARQRLLPAIDSFGGRLEQTLGVILAGLFADASAVLEAPDARPIYVFSPSAEPGAEMEVELLDAGWFEPMELGVKWLNDHIMVRSPRIADREVLARLAEDLYEGEDAGHLREGAAESVAAMQAAWAEGRARLMQEVEALLDHVSGEIARSAERLRLGQAYFEEVLDYTEDMDRLIALARVTAEQSDAAGRGLSDMADELLQARFAMVADLMAEISAGDAAMQAAEDRLRALRAEVRDLTEKLAQW